MRRWSLLFPIAAAAAAATVGAAQGYRTDTPERFLDSMARSNQGYGFTAETFLWMADAAAEEGYINAIVVKGGGFNQEPTRTTKAGGALSAKSYVLMAECPFDRNGDGCVGGIDVTIKNTDSGATIVQSPRTQKTHVIPFTVPALVENWSVTTTIHDCIHVGQPAENRPQWGCETYVVLWEVPRGARTTKAPAAATAPAPAASTATPPAVPSAAAGPAPIDSYLTAVAGTAAKQGYTKSVHVFRGTLAPKGEEIVTLALPDKGEYAILGVCDNECSRLDLTILGPKNTVLLDDSADDDLPVLAMGVELGGTWPLRVRLPACSAARCAWAVGVYRK